MFEKKVENRGKRYARGGRKTKNIVVHCTRWHHEKAKEIAEHLGCSMSEYLNKLLVTDLSRRGLRENTDLYGIL